MSREWSRPVVVKANERIISVARDANASEAPGKAGKQGRLGTGRKALKPEPNPLGLERRTDQAAGGGFLSGSEGFTGVIF